MSYTKAVENLILEEGVEQSTMMSSPCLRYNGNFIAMMFDREDALIIKVSQKRVDELIDEGIGREFNFTKKKFKEWVLIPADYENRYESFIHEALELARESTLKKNKMQK